MLNRVILIGHLASDPELRYTSNGTAACSFRLAVDGPYNGPDGKPQAVFINILVWGKLAEVCANNLAKGRLVAVEGKLNEYSYEAKDRTKRWKTEVVASIVKFLGKWKETTSGENMDDVLASFGTEVKFSEDELPF